MDGIFEWNSYIEVDGKIYYKPFRNEGFYLVDSNPTKTTIIAECNCNAEASLLATLMNRFYPIPSES